MSRNSININHKNLEFEVSPFDNNGEINEDNIPSHVEDIHNKTEENIINILFIITLSNIWTLILVILPVVVEIGSDNLYYKQDGWYGVNDILRFIEPVGGLMFSFWIYHSSGFFSKHPIFEVQTMSLLFMFGASLYCQGGAFHSASVMYKHAVEIYKDDRPGDKYLTDLMYWIRTVWEHEISHYLYGTGAAIMAGVQAWAYRDIILRRTPSDTLKLVQYFILLNGFLYGFLIAIVSIDFPSGIIVGLIYLGLYGFGIVGRYVWFNDGLSFTMFGRRPILNYFFLSYIIAFCLIIIWIILTGGISESF